MLNQTLAIRYKFTNFARFPGQPGQSNIHEDISRRTSPYTQKIVTLTPTAQNSAVYTVVVDTETESITSDGSGTQAEIVAALQNAIRGNARMYGQVTVSGSTTLIVTVRDPGSNLNIQAGTSNLAAVVTQAAGVASSMPFGTFTMQATDADYCQNPSSSAALPKIVDLTPIAVNSQNFSIFIERMDTGAAQNIEVTSDGSATAQEIATAMAGELTLTDFTAADTSAKLRLTGPDGVDYRVTVTQGDFTYTVVQASSAAAFTRAILGVLTRDHTVGQVTEGSSLTIAGSGTGYPAGRAAGIRSLGPVAVMVDADIASSISDGDPVYIRTTAGTGEYLGSTRNDADGGDAVLLTGCKFRSTAELVGDVYVAEVNLTNI